MKSLRMKGYPTTNVFEIGEPTCICEFCGAILWRQESTLMSRGHVNPKFELCCKQGKVKLPPRREPPEFLKILFESDTTLARHFREYIRTYNGIFCFTSIEGKVDHAINDGSVAYVYSIGGQIYHRVGSLVPADGDTPKFAQLYIYETNNEVQNRYNFYSANRNTNPLRHVVIQQLKEMLDANNVLVQSFRSTRDRIDDPHFNRLKIKLLAKRRIDGREYDLPTGDEIAALIVDETGADSFQPDIIVQQGSRMERVSMYHPSLMALQYPILFPYGEDGWYPSIPYSEEQEEDEETEESIGFRTGNVSQCDYYSYRLQTRIHDSNSLLFAGKLLQQYVVNAYALVEAERLDWIRNNQSKLRMHYFSGLMDPNYGCITLATFLQKLMDYPTSILAWVLISRLNSEDQPIVALLPMYSCFQGSGSTKVFQTDKRKKPWECPWGVSVIDVVAPDLKNLMDQIDYGLLYGGDDLKGQREGLVELDNHLGEFLRMLQEGCFGIWSVLLDEQSNSPLIDELESNLFQNLQSKCNSTVNRTLLRSILVKGSELNPETPIRIY